jgi:transposase
MKRLQASTALARGRAKRRHYDQAFKRHLVELTLVPGASVARIALDHRINANILFRWRRHYLREIGGASPKPATELLPVRVSDAQQALELISESAPSLRARNRGKPERGAGGVIEIELAGGQLRLTGSVDLEALRVVLETLSHK